MDARTFDAGRWDYRRSSLWDVVHGWAMMAGRDHGHGPGRHQGWAKWGTHFGHWGPGGFSGAFFGRGPKVGRGDVRSAILGLLAEEPMHGYQIIQELTERSGGIWRPSPGSIYPTLQQLEDEGLVRADKADGRRVFKLTDTGRAEAARRAEGGSPPWAMWDESSPLADLRDIGIGVATAVVQVAQAGNPDQVERAKEILTDARKRLYRLLAEDGPDEAI